MLKLDEFESVFKSASKYRYHFHDIEIDQVLIVNDLEPELVGGFVDRARDFLRGIFHGRTDVLLQTINKREYGDVPGLFQAIEQNKPDLIVAYRNLGSNAWKYPYSLGEDLDVLTQATTTPVLVLPNPHAKTEAAHAVQNTNVVMVVADHLTGDDRIVDWGVRFTEPDGQLFLTHVESRSNFDHYVETIAKIPELDTDVAKETLREQLLKEPRDYVESVRSVLESSKVPIRIEAIVRLGHRLEEYRQLIEKHEVDLLVMNTKDQRQQAMDSLAYKIAVEIRDIPLLML